MKKIITLNTYFCNCGELSGLDLNKTYTTYLDSNKGKTVVAINPIAGRNGTQLYKITYADGKQHIYSGTWIETEVEFILHPKFTN
jgi:hypothetical protein